MSFLLRAALAAFIIVLTPAAFAEEPMDPVSQTIVHRIDPVDAVRGDPQLGTPLLALRDGNVVRYFRTAENCGDYVADQTKFPDADRGVKLAFFGVDIVERYPYDIHADALGPIIAGDPTKYAVRYKGALFAFSTEANKEAFAAHPGRWELPVGAHCLLAMASDHVVPGDPRETRLYKAKGTWIVFGSAHGPAAWDAMTEAERHAAWVAANENYRRRLALAPVATNDNGRYQGDVLRAPLKKTASK